MSYKNLPKYMVYAFYTVVTLLVIFYVWTRNVNHQVSTGDFPLYRSFQDTPSFIRHGFDPAQLQEIPVLGSEWVKHEQWPPRIRDSALPNLPSRSIISPRKEAASEFTIIIPIEIDKTAISYLNVNPSVIPGIYLAHIAENWEIYFNGELMLSEMHLNEEGRIKSQRYWRHVYFPVDRSLIEEGTNILALRILGDPRRGSTGLRLINYLCDYRVIQSRSHFFTEMLLCGFSAFIGVYFILLFLSIKNRKPDGSKPEHFYLYFGIFSMLICCYVTMRYGIINFLIPNSYIARLLEYLSLMFLVVFFGMFVETLGKGKLTKITQGYIVFCLTLAFTQIFIFGHWGEEAISLLNIPIFFYYSFVFFYDVFYCWHFQRARQGEASRHKNRQVSSPDASASALIGTHRLRSPRRGIALYLWGL